MSQAIMQSTQIGVSLSLIIVTKTDDTNRLNMAHIADVTRLIFWLWSLGQWVNQMTSKGAIWAARVVYTFDLMTWLLTWSKTWLKTWLKTPMYFYLASMGLYETVKGFLANRGIL